MVDSCIMWNQTHNPYFSPRIQWEQWKHVSSNYNQYIKVDANHRRKLMNQDLDCQKSPYSFQNGLEFSPLASYMVFLDPLFLNFRWIKSIKL